MAGTKKTRGRRGLLLLGAAALTALTALVFVVVFSGNPQSPEKAGQAPPSFDVTAAGRPVMAKSEPLSVDIPKIAAHSSLVSLGLNADNTIQVPPVNRPMQAGWYSYGPTPGEAGPAVVLGHVDGNKAKGIFSRLKELAPGDEVTIARKDGSTARFVVRKVDEIAKDVFPTDAVYGNTAGPELRLITCGGTFDHAAHSYRDNIIVYANLA